MQALRTTTSLRPAAISGVGTFRPERVVPNSELVERIDSSDEWIQQRTGIVERRWATDEQTPLSMALEAGQLAIERAGLSASDIDTVIISTDSHFQQTPSLAVSVAAGLGIEDAAAWDISAACAGFCYGVGQADALVRGGLATHVLLIGVETLSRVTDLTDRGTAFLFSDGAGAVVIGPSDEPAIGPTVWGSDGHQSEVITIKSWDHPEANLSPKIEMDGRTVFRWATTASPTRPRKPWLPPVWSRATCRCSFPTRPTTASPTRCFAIWACPTRWSSPATSSGWATRRPPRSPWPWRPCSRTGRPRAATSPSPLVSALDSSTPDRPSDSPDG